MSVEVRRTVAATLGASGNASPRAVLEGFVADGETILRRLGGMFAFVIWDRETGELFAARDQVGVKPLY
jgi:asparagine synthase (glutamine-hydrolysing)